MERFLTALLMGALVGLFIYKMLIWRKNPKYFWLIFLSDIKHLPRKIKRVVWNGGIKLQWNRLWIRKDEFHSSLDLKSEVMLGMSQKRRDKYIKDLCRRRHIAHERDLNNT